MPVVTLDELQRVAHRAAPLYHDAYSERALSDRVQEYEARRRPGLSPFTLTVDGKPYASLFEAILEKEAGFQTAELTLTNPPPPGVVWEYLVPFRKLEFASEGSVELYPLSPVTAPSRRAIARTLLREHYVPRSESQEGEAAGGATVFNPETGLATLSQAVTWTRRTGVVPLGVALLLYFPEERVRLELDLLGSALLPDPRAGRLPITRRVRRSPRASHGLDARIARGELPVMSARILEVLFETHGLTAVELAHVFGGLRELGTTALESLRARRYAVYDRRTGVYRPRLEAFLSAEERVRGREEVLPPLPNPALRTSVMELIAAADSRATCPLCGDALPPGPRAILCARCQAEVGGGHPAVGVE